MSWPVATFEADPEPLRKVIRVMLVEDDDGDALLVEELLIDGGEGFDLARVGSVRSAIQVVAAADCALVDLGLPDAFGLAAVEQLKAVAPTLPIVVLTGHNDRARGLAALAIGAQDYLVKGQVDGPTLARAIRYAIERRRAEANGRRLLLAEQRQAENDRLARGLLPRLGVTGRGVETATRYQPGGRDALLGGDFFDAIQMADGAVRAIIGDVCGHGPDEAAVGVALRIAWRTLVLTGAPSTEVMRGVDRVLRHERTDPDAYATACDLTVAADGRTCVVRLHGHPPPLIVSPETRWMTGATPSPPLGSVTYKAAEACEMELGPVWAMVLTTDGLHEARAGRGRLGMDAVAAIAASIEDWAVDPDTALAELLRRVTAINGSDLEDDVALLWIGSMK